MGKKLTTKEFIEKANAVHGVGKYDYSKVDYVNSHSKVLIGCPKHGDFEQVPNYHLNKCGCPACALEKQHNRFALTQDQFIAKANEVHNNKYDYSLVEYYNSNSIIKIICPEHGVFEQKAGHHLEGHECPSCSGCKKYSTKSFIECAKKVHGNKYSYDRTVYKNAKSKVIVTCPVHGDFIINAHSHLSGCGCGECNESHGEVTIARILDENNIEFQSQKTFIDCKNVKLLPFDFYLPDYNLAIEFDGEQHYRSVDYWGGENTFKKVKYRDNIKTNYCYDNDVILCRIKYNQDIYKELSKYIELKETDNG